MTWWEFMLVMTLVIPVMVLWIGCIIDVVGRPDLRGVQKALWMVGIILLPIFGSLMYVIARPSAYLSSVQHYEDMYEQHVPEPEARSGTAEQAAQSLGGPPVV